MGLQVGVLGAEEFFGAVAGQVLHHVGKLAAAVVTPAGISLGIFVGQDRSGGFEHSFAHEVYRGDQFEAVVLAAGLVVKSKSDFRVGGGKAVFHTLSMVSTNQKQDQNLKTHYNAAATKSKVKTRDPETRRKRRKKRRILGGLSQTWNLS